MDGDTNKNAPPRDSALSQDVPRVAVYETDDDANINISDNTRVDTAANNSDTVFDARARYDVTVEPKSDDRSPDEIERDIEQTQDRIAGSIDELARRLSPTHIKDQAVQSLNENLNIPGLKHFIGDVKGNVTEGAKTAGVKMLEGVKHNPLSSAFVGVGLGLAAVGGIIAARTDAAQMSTGYGSNYSANRNLNTKTRTYDERLRDMMETIENKDNHTSEDSSTSKLQSAKNVVSGGVQHAKEATMHGAQVAKDGLTRALDAQPLAIGAVALLAGAAVGLLLPRTSYEDSLMGERSDQLISQAKGKAGEYVEAAKGTVNEVLQTAKDTAKEVVQTTKDAAKEAVKV
jgi:uncharacterized protein YaaR (DUF327 family)